MSVPSSSSSRSRWTYHVFLSFRGGDTRKNFTDHLYTALIQAGIHTFRDDDALPRGEEISPQLVKAIHESKVSLVVFSKGYASSRWCLNELVEIIECKRWNSDQIVIPIFYDVDPSDVREQTGSFGEAFDGHKERFKGEVNKWREVLYEAGNLSGWDLKILANGHESKFIQKIVEDVSNKLDHRFLNVATYPVGIDSRVDRIIHLLSINTNAVCIVGIYGMPGIGKTTIAKAVFNRLCYGFEGCCFLFNVKEISEKHGGLVKLQEQLLYDILKPNVFKVCDEHRGINLIKDRLCRKRVLIVVDDVDQLKQLDALVGQRSWFSPGSKIIITTRDERLLTQFEVDKRFMVKELNEDESLQLFSLHAFRDTNPLEDYLELSNLVMKYSGGLPLALEVLGSFLFKRSKTEWESEIQKLRKIAHHDIQKKLRLSFDTLDDDIKHAFLDISCFFVGRDIEYVAKILHARCGFRPEINIITLIERSLLTVDFQNELRMHDLLRDMGREIVRQTSPYHPGNRSRVWFHEEARDVLYKQTGTINVEGLALDVRASESVSFSTESFTNMRFLQLLQIDGVQLNGSYEHLSKELIWLSWFECPLKSLPSNLELDNITVLDMEHSNLIEVWKEAKFLSKLKVLNLSHSENLAKVTNFLGLTNLERLLLEDCPSLVEVHQSIGCLKRLVFLNLKGCCRLKILPESMGALKSLKTLNVIDCSKLEKLPQCLGDMESLSELLADGTKIRQLPSSIGHLKNLKRLSLVGINYNENLPSTSCLSVISLWLSPRSLNSKALLPDSLFGLSSLQELNLSYCGLSDGIISGIHFGSLSSLEYLLLSGNKFFNMPSGIGCLPKLHFLDVADCRNLLSISELPSSLNHLEANNCTSMEKLSLIQSETRKSLELQGCQSLKEIEGMEVVCNEWLIGLGECNNLSNNCKKNILQALCKREMYSILLEGGEVPEWFSHCEEGSSVSLQVPDPVSHGMLQKLLIWVIFVGISTYPGNHAHVILRKKSNGALVFRRTAVIFGNYKNPTNHHSWICHFPFTGFPQQCALEVGDELELSAELFAGEVGEVEKCGVHLVVREPDKTADHPGKSNDHIEESQGSNSTTDWLIRDLQQLQFSSVGIPIG